MGGLIAGVKKINTKAGAVMAFVTVEDLYGNIDCLAFPRVYEKIRGIIKQDAVVKVTGKIDISPDKLPVIMLETLEEFDVDGKEEAKATVNPVQKTDAEKVLWLDARELSEEDFEELIEMMEGYVGGTLTKILHGGKRFEYAVNVTKAFQAELRTFLPDEKIKLL